jgi:hypothetical protein
VRVGGAGVGGVARVDFYAGARRVAQDRRPPFAKAVPRRFLRTTTRVRALAFLKDARLATLDWRVRACP